MERSKRILAEKATSEAGVRQTRQDEHSKTTTASLAELEASAQSAQQQIAVAQANVAKTESRIKDATLTSPITGRVLYRLTEPGEVLGPGGKALTLVNLEDVYMEIFLPAEQAASDEGWCGSTNHPRLSNRTPPPPARVSFVSPEAQFTPKQVETQERAREADVPRQDSGTRRACRRITSSDIKTGVRGVGYVKT